MMIHYDDELAMAASAASNQGVTRFDLAESDLQSLQSSMVDLDLNLLPLDAKTLPEEAVIHPPRTPHNVRGGRPRNRMYNTDTIRSTHSAKSVTIANKVTEFHYSGTTV